MDGMAVGLIALRVTPVIAGLIIIVGTLVSAIKTFILPRGVNVWLTRAVFRSMGFFFRLRLRGAAYEDRDRIMAFFPPFALFSMPMILLVLVLRGYMLLFWALEPRPFPEIFILSGSSLLTLGYASVNTTASKLLEFSEAMIGLVLIAMLIAYLPTMYSAFSRRETAVVLWEARGKRGQVLRLPSQKWLLAPTARANWIDCGRFGYLGKCGLPS